MNRAGEGRSRLTFAVLLVLGAALIAGFLALGTWQVQRRAWKLDLIARVKARVNAPPVAAPAPQAWPRLDARNAEYLRVRARGRFLHDRETLVQAVTELGPGFWVLTPLATDRDFLILVNRGFVPQDRRRPASRPEGPASVTGLLRVSEPAGGFLRRNDPAAGRWYSRDVAAIARAHRLGPTAPYFVDAEAAPGEATWPRGGLTRIRFRNDHLSYALTWYALAILVAVGLVLLVRHRRRRGEWTLD